MIKSNSIYIFTDAAMTLFLPFAFAYKITGESVHEVIGFVLMSLFFIHNFLNRRWYGSIFKGKYGFCRLANALVNIALAVVAISMFCSGFLISGYSPLLLDASDGIQIRQIHSVCAYWLLTLVGVHLGLNFGRIRSKLNIRQKNASPIMKLAALFLAAFGMWAWCEREMYGKLFLGYSFDFLDSEYPHILFLAEIFSILWLAAYVTYSIFAINKKHANKRMK